MMNEQQHHKNYEKQQRRMVVKSNFIPKVSGSNVRDHFMFTQSVINQAPKIPKPISSMQNHSIMTPSSNTVHDQQAITTSSLSSMQSYIGKPPKRNKSPPIGVQAGFG